MDIKKITNLADELESYAKSKGVPMTTACERAGVDYSTFARWRKDLPRTIVIVQRITNAIDAEAEARGGA